MKREKKRYLITVACLLSCLLMEEKVKWPTYPLHGFFRINHTLKIVSPEDFLHHFQHFP